MFPHAKNDNRTRKRWRRHFQEILERRQDENAADPYFLPHGGDGGWVFPSVSRDGKSVIALAEPKEYKLVLNAKGQAKTDDEGDRDPREVPAGARTRTGARTTACRRSSRSAKCRRKRARRS